MKNKPGFINDYGINDSRRKLSSCETCALESVLLPCEACRFNTWTEANSRKFERGHRTKIR